MAKETHASLTVVEIVYCERDTCQPCCSWRLSIVNETHASLAVAGDCLW